MCCIIYIVVQRPTLWHYLLHNVYKLSVNRYTIGVNSVFSWPLWREKCRTPPPTLWHRIPGYVCNISPFFFIVKTWFLPNLSIIQKPNGRREQSKLQRWCVCVTSITFFYFFVKNPNQDEFSSWYLKNDCITFPPKSTHFWEHHPRGGDCKEHLLCV
jgi:hypothetical protein